MWTPTGRRLAQEWAPQTERFLRSLLDHMQQVGMPEVTVEEVEFEGLDLLVVAPASCSCGRALSRRVWQVPGLKCSEIHLSHDCSGCGESHEVRFCRPRLQSAT
jgi:hypothetical protein